MKKDSDFDWPFFIVLLALIFQTLSIFLELMHKWNYSKNGEGLYACDLIAQISSEISQFIIGLFLIMLSWGWSITYVGEDIFDIFFPIGLLLGIVHFIVIILGKISDG